jgi:hypothetical protein
MVEDVAQLKAELNDLNVKCQLARDNEIRFALQRSRLEAERAKLLVKIMEAMAATPAPAVAPAAPYHVVVQQAPITPPAAPTHGTVAVTDTPAEVGRHNKPADVTVPDMVEAVLQNAPQGLRPCEITAAIQEHYWPEAPRTWVSSVVWHMGQKGRLAKTGNGRGRLYRLAARTNGHGH